MNLKEHFESIIEKIEKKAANSYEQKVCNIVEDICNEEFINIREFNAIFKFLTDNSLTDYIKERKMMIAYKTLIDDEEFNLQPAIEISGLDNQNSFGKKFKETFGLTPTEAHKKRDEKLYKSPLSWEYINSNEQQTPKRFNEPEEMLFGVSRSQYDKIMEASDYKSLYNFSDSQSDVAFQISEKEKISIKDAFMLVDDYLEYYKITHNEEPSEKKLKFLLSPRSKQMKRLYFEATGSIFGAFDLIEEANECEVDIRKINSEYLEEYYKNPYCDLEELLEQIESFEKFGGKDFEEYMLLVYTCGFSEEDAARGTYDSLDDCDFGSLEDIEMFYNETTEQWTQENVDYDEDNPYYDDSDTDILE